MLKRGKKVDTKQVQYNLVIYGFIAVCVIAILLHFLMPKQKLYDQLVLDDSEILVHNGQGHKFKHGRNKFFEGKIVRDFKPWFALNHLVDPNLGQGAMSICATSITKEGQGDDIKLPDSYDWREAYP